MNKQALIVWGGWDGHEPQQCADLFAPLLEASGYDVTLRNDLDAYADLALMEKMDLIVPIWTMGEITAEQWAGLNQAVQRGVGIAGFHGGMIDAFRDNPEYQFMTGGQWVAHPGNLEPTYTVTTTDAGKEHEICQGIEAFTLTNTEQYYIHIDPAANVLMTTAFNDLGDTTLYTPGVAMPFAWTKKWGQGRVFVACWGHTHEDFDVPAARDIVLRGMIWATRD